MSAWPVGISTGGYYRTNILECLEEIRDAGFSMIEVCSYPQHLDYHDRSAVQHAAKRIQQLHLEPYSFHAPFADRIDISALDDTQREGAIQDILRAAEAASELGAHYFVIHPGPETPLPIEKRLERMERAADALNRISERCRQLGGALVLENMLPHLFFGNARDMLWILGAIRTVDVGICLDIGHAHLSGDLTTVVHKLSGHLWMIHASDNKGERDDHLPPGEGKVDWESLFRQLMTVRFIGGIILEIASNCEGKLDLSAASRARSFIKEIATQTELQMRLNSTVS
jgi:sugar phosphate isomerase/epimerase